MADLCVFTCNYAHGPEKIALLRRSCDLQDIDLQVYGEGETWPGFTAAKIAGAQTFLRGRTEPFAMFVDGHDSIVIDRASAILEKFQRIGSSVVIAGEKTCWPQADLGAHYPYPKPPFHNSPWRFINAGGWIGERRALLDVLAYAEHQAMNDDQLAWTMEFLYTPTGRLFINIDAGCQIFQSMGGTASHELGPTGENLITHQKPSVLHFNGRSPHIGLWYRTLTGDLGWKGE